MASWTPLLETLPHPVPPWNVRSFGGRSGCPISGRVHSMDSCWRRQQWTTPGQFPSTRPTVVRRCSGCRRLAQPSNSSLQACTELRAQIVAVGGKTRVHRSPRHLSLVSLRKRAQQHSCLTRTCKASGLGRSVCFMYVHDRRKRASVAGPFWL